MKRTVQWQGDNQVEVDRFLSLFQARTDKDGDVLHVLALNKRGAFANIRLELGDCLIFENGRVGVTRGRVSDVEPMIEWTGENVQAVSEFLKTWNVDISVIGDDLYLRGAGEPTPIILHRGDRIIERGAALVISVAGKDHRV
jgi:hypothetical protein